MKKILLIGLTVVAMVGLMVNCEKDDDHLDAQMRAVFVEGGQDNWTPIIAGQNIEAGKVSLEDVDTNGSGSVDALRVTFETDGDWVIQKVHFALGYSVSDIPRNKPGNMIPGQFPYHSDNFETSENVQEYILDIPFEAFDFECTNAEIYSAAHLELALLDESGNVIQTETGWAEGDNRPGKNWGMIFSFVIDCENPKDVEEEEPECESAWAYKAGYATCFEDMEEIDANRWGWSNGPFAPGEYVLDLYAAAGQCNLNSGYKVGTVTVEYIIDGEGDYVEVKYEMLPGFDMVEAHLYIGEEPLHERKQGNWFVPTVAPGQFPYKIEFESYATEWEVSVPVDGDFYVVAHADVCGEAPPPSNCVDEITVYGVVGTGGNGSLWAIEIINNSFATETQLISYNLSGDTYSGNGLAYDEENNRLYFAVGSGSSGWSLYFYDFGGTSQAENIHLAATNLPGQIYGATWGDGKYWYIQNGTQNMSRVSFDANGKNGTYEVFEQSFANHANKSYHFGDMSMDENGVIYVSSSFTGSTKEFFSYDTKQPEGNRYYWIQSTHPDHSGQGVDAIGLQLGFAYDGNLYGHATGTQEWFRISNKIRYNVDVTPLGTGTNSYNDLSTGPSVLCP